MPTIDTLFENKISWQKRKKCMQQTSPVVPVSGANSVVEFNFIHVLQRKRGKQRNTLSRATVGVMSSSMLCLIDTPAPSQNVPRAETRAQKYTDFPEVREEHKGTRRCESSMGKRHYDSDCQVSISNAAYAPVNTDPLSIVIASVLLMTVSERNAYFGSRYLPLNLHRGDEPQARRTTILVIQKFHRSSTTAVSL